MEKSESESFLVSDVYKNVKESSLDKDSFPSKILLFFKGK